MDELAKVLSALSALAWPVVFAVLLFKLYEPIRKLVDSASGRKFTLKVAGNELSMEEASEQQGKIVRDLQLKLAELEKQLSASAAVPSAARPPGAAASMAPRAPMAARPAGPAAPSAPARRILWVDDMPRNNSFLIAALQERGVRVDTATSTDEGLARAKASRYDAVVSDMGRPEGEQAGIDLTRQLKALQPQTPVFLFCSPHSALALRDEALAAGADGITASGTSLLSALPLDPAP